MWIGLEIQTLSAFDSAYLELVDALTNAIRPVEYKELKCYVLTNSWQQVVIIPMIKGATLSHLSWRILSSFFVGNEAVLSEEKAWLNIPKPLPEEAVNYFKFEQIEGNNFDKFNALSKELSELYAAVMHFSNFAAISSNLNGTGEKVLQEYLSGFYVKLAGNYSAYLMD